MTDERDLEVRLQAVIGGQYRIVRELGGGGMSRVFLADEVELGRQVVIKVLPPEMAAGVSVDRFRREILLAASLQHPHVVPLLSAGASGDLLYYIMPYIDGESLRQKLEREGELPVGEVVRILREVVDALEYAHSRGIVHRDIKPENVMLARKHALVTDFGVAKAVAESGKHSLTSMGVALGTPTYMAPEQASADPHTDHRADIYAVGVMAYEMLCGRPPFVGNNPQSVLAAHVTQAPDPIAAHRQTVPEGLQAIIMRCLEKRAADRWQSADDLAPALEGYAVSSGGITPTGTRPVEAVATAPRSAPGARPLRVAILFGLSAAVVLALVFLAVQWVGLPDWVMLAAGILLAAGLPIMLLTGHVERKRVTSHTPSAGRAGWRRLFTWKRAVLGGVGAFVVLALAVGGYMAMRSLGIGPVGTLMASGAIGDRDRLVLADFTNRTSDSTLARSVTEALRIDLAQSPVIRLLDPADISAALTRMQRSTDSPMDLALAREIAEREGAKAIVTGEISPVGEGYVLSATILSSEDGAVLVAQRETAENPGALIAAIDRLSGKLRERIGESLKSIRDAEPLEDVSTASLEALERYTQAIRLEARGDAPAAIGLLEEATSIDTAFAMAWRKLAVIRANSAGSQDAVVDAASRAFVHRERLPRKERYLAEGYYYSTVDYQPERVIAAYRSLLDIDPENNTALNNLSIEYGNRREFATAESLLTRAAAVDNHWTGYANLMQAKLALGKVDEARNVLERYAAIAPGSDPLTRMRMILAAWQDDGDSAEAFARELEASDDPGQRFIAGYNQAARAELHGRLTDADDQLRQIMSREEARDNARTYSAPRWNAPCSASGSWTTPPRRDAMSPKRWRAIRSTACRRPTAPTRRWHGSTR